MIIPSDQLDEDVLDAIIEQFVLREGTDYGAQEYVLADKVRHVRGQIERGEAFILYSELHESVDIISKAGLERLSEAGGTE